MTTKRAFLAGFSGALALAAALFVIRPFDTPNASAAENNRENKQRAMPQLNINSNPLPKETGAITSFAPVVKRVGPSVVTITSTRTVRQEMRMLPFFDDPMFRRFFGVPDEGDESDPPGRGRTVPREFEQQGLGSGVIVSADGYILSNNHVVEGADEVKVTLAGSDEEIVAEVIGTDPQTDIAVLKIDRTGLTPITLTDSDQLQVGDIVLAIGNPFNVGQTVTMGIVSATGRGFFGRIASYEDFIQTDAAINMGNSGGALVDANGRLVGINTAIISRTGGNMGIGFAVPINMARRVMEAIVQSGKVTRGYLGVSIRDVTGPLAEKFELKSSGGALVNDVQARTPAREAGIEPGDVIVEFNGRKVPDSRQLRLWVSQTPPNTKSTLKIIRDGKERTVNVTLGELPEQLAGGPGSRGPTPEQREPEALDGVEVGDLNQRIRRQFDIPSDVRGALVTNVDPNSTAAAAGLQPGDVIMEIEKEPVSDAQEAIDLSSKLDSSKPILLRVWSRRLGGGASYIVIEPEKRTPKRE